MGIRTVPIISNFNVGNFFDSSALFFGSDRDAAFVYDIKDADANMLKTDFKAAADGNVPVHAYGVGIADVDLGFFNGETQPQIAVIDLDQDSWIKIGFSADDVPAIQIGGAATALQLPAVTALTILAAENFFYLTESDQTDPVGRWRFRVNSDVMYLEHALTGSWASDLDILTITAYGSIDLTMDILATVDHSSGLTMITAVYDDYATLTTNQEYKGLYVRYNLKPTTPGSPSCEVTGIEGVAASYAAFPSNTVSMRGGYFRTYIDADNTYRAKTSIGCEMSARASYSGGTECVAEEWTVFTGARIWMAPYFTSGSLATINNFWGLWIAGEHATQRNADAAIYISDAGGKFTDSIRIASGGTWTGSDCDINIVKLVVDGTPVFSWDESEDCFSFTHGIVFEEQAVGTAATCHIARDNSGDLTINAISGQTINLAIAGTDELALSSTTLDLKTNTITNVGTITVTNAAGPAFVNETATNTNPTLVPNRNEMDTGIGWTSTDIINIVLGSANEYSFSTTALNMNGNALDNCGFIILNDASAPADTEVYLVNDNSGDLTLNALSTKAINLAIAGADIINLTATAMTAGANGSGVTDLKFYGDGSGCYLEWNASTDTVKLYGDIKTDRWDDSDTNVYIGVEVCGGGAASGTTDNVLIGYQVANDITSANKNVIIGSGAYKTATTANKNVIIGWHAVNLSATWAREMVVIGYEAGEHLTTGCDNIMMGYQAGHGTTTGGRNILIGYYAGAYGDADYQVITEQNCIIIGTYSLPSSTIVDGYIAIGQVGQKACLISDNEGDWEIRAMSGKSIDLKIATTDEYQFGATAADFNGNNITALGTLGMTGAITIAPTSTGTYLDFVLEDEWTAGTLIRADYASGTTASEAICGMLIDYGNLTPLTTKAVTGYELIMPAFTQSGAGTTNMIGFYLSTAGALVNTNGTINWFGESIAMPNVTETSGTIVSIGLAIAGGTKSATAQQFGIRLGDNLILALGTTFDGAIVLNTAGVAADAALADVIVGTSRHLATAANSLLISNITSEGDIQFLVNDGGNSWGMLTFNADDHSAHFGQSDYGVPVYFHGATAAYNMKWAEASDQLQFTGATILISPEGAGTMIDFALDDEWVSGTLINADFGASTTFSSGVVGFNLDLGANIVATSRQDVTGIDINLPQMSSDATSPTLSGIIITSEGALAQVTSGATNWRGVDITMPAQTQTADTIVSYGVEITATGYTSGTQTGLKIGNMGSYSIYTGTGQVYFGDAVDIVKTQTIADNVVQITVTDTATLGSGYGRGLYISYTANGTHTGTYVVRGLAVDVFTSADVFSIKPAAFYIGTITSTVDLVVGLDIYAEDIGASITNFMALDVGFNSGNLASNRHTGIRVVNHAGTAKQAIDIEGAYTVGIDLYAGYGATTCATADIRLQEGHIILDEGWGIQIDHYQVGDTALNPEIANRKKFYFVEGGAGTADLLYCIMKGADNLYTAVQVAVG